MQFTLFASFFALLTAVSADRTVVLLLNDGVPGAYSCSDTELTKVSAVLTASSLNSTYARRNLRTPLEDLDDMTESMMVDPKHRTLVYPRKCGTLCEGYKTGTCLVTDCIKYRRRELEGERNGRNLLSGASFTCTQQVNYINAALDTLAGGTQVSASCKNLLNSPRDITCFDDIIYGVVEYFKLWDTNASPQKVINSNYTGQDITRGLEINMEAITNNCVDYLLTSLSGPNGFYRESGEYIRPFTVFGDSFTVDGKINGLTLPHLGQYTLTALPDGLDEKKKVITFNVVPGTVTAVKLWDITTKTVINSNFTGGNVCNSKTVNFEAVMPLAASSKITLTSTNGFSQTNIEAAMPYTVMGDVNGLLSGKKLSNGAYTLTIYPDEAMSNKVKTITFNVVTC